MTRPTHYCTFKNDIAENIDPNVFRFVEVDGKFQRPEVWAKFDVVAQLNEVGFIRKAILTDIITDE